MQSPKVPHSYQLVSHSGRAASASDSARSAFVRPPIFGEDAAGTWPVPQILLPWSVHAAHTPVSSLWRWPLFRYSLCRRTNVARFWGAAQLSAAECAATVLHHADWLRRRLRTAGFHGRRPGYCAWSLFFPRSVGLGPTASCANGALTSAPSMLCQTQAMPSSSSYSANPRRQSFTNTPACFQARKYLWTELALPYARGNAFHWHPVRRTYTMASKTRRGARGFRPPPGRRLYRCPLGRLGVGMRDATRSHSASDTVQDLMALMPYKVINSTHERNNYLRISSKYS